MSAGLCRGCGAPWSPEFAGLPCPACTAVLPVQRSPLCQECGAVDAQRTRAEAAEAEVARLRAIVEGRTTADDPVADWIAAEERAPMADRLAVIAWQRLTCVEREDAARRAPGLVVLRRARGVA